MKKHCLGVALGLLTLTPTVHGLSVVTPEILEIARVSKKPVKEVQQVWHEVDQFVQEMKRRGLSNEDILTAALTDAQLKSWNPGVWTKRFLYISACCSAFAVTGFILCTIFSIGAFSAATGYIMHKNN